MTEYDIPDKLYFKIGDICRIAKIQPYVLRYWETEFPQLSPSKSKSGQRIYSREDLDIILKIKTLLYEKGFTIAGAKKKLETGDTAPPPQTEKTDSDSPHQKTLIHLLKELYSIRDILT